MKYYLHLSLLSILLLAWPAIATPPPAAQQGAAYDARSQRYVDCTVKTRTHPEQALQEAQAWAKESQEAAASHCQALALYQLKRYEESGTILSRLSERIGDDQLVLKASVLSQAAHSWKFAKQYDKAEASYGSAIALTGGKSMPELTASLLLERAQLYADQKKPLQATQDLDHLLSLDEKNTPARMLRARLFTQLQQPGMARDDYVAILAKDPNHLEARAALAALGTNVGTVPPPTIRTPAVREQVAAPPKAASKKQPAKAKAVKKKPEVQKKKPVKKPVKKRAE